MKILVTRIYKNATLDNYENGEDPSTTQMIDLDGSGYADSLERLADFFYLPKDKENWMAFDEGRIICSVMENAAGEIVDENDPEFEKFKAGEIDLYACEYNFFIEFVETHTPTPEEIAEKFNIETYD